MCRESPCLARSAFVTPSDRGRTVPNYSYLLGNMCAGALSNLYYPQANRGAHLAFTNTAIGLAGRAGEWKRMSTSGKRDGVNGSTQHSASERRRLYADDSTLATSMHLAEAANLPAGELVPQGIESLARTTLLVKAILELQGFREDKCEGVRTEALISLQRLGPNESCVNTTQPAMDRPRLMKKVELDYSAVFG